MFLRNVSTYLQIHMELQLRRHLHFPTVRTTNNKHVFQLRVKVGLHWTDQNIRPHPRAITNSTEIRRAVSQIKHAEVLPKLYSELTFKYSRGQQLGQLCQFNVWLRIGRPGDRGSILGRGERIFPLASGSGTQTASCAMGTGSLFPGAKARPGRDAYHSPPHSAEVKNE
jgi:hypothetical protein